MKQAHLVKLSVFCKEENNYQEILKKFLGFFPFNLEKEKIVLDKKEAMGLENKKITILEATLEKDRHIKEFLENLLKKLSGEEKEKILLQKESRLDENLDFFLRFDKEQLIKNNELILTDSGNCFHIKISIAAFPKKRNIALGIINNMFG